LSRSGTMGSTTNLRASVAKKDLEEKPTNKAYLTRKPTMTTPGPSGSSTARVTSRTRNNIAGTGTQRTTSNLRTDPANASPNKRVPATAASPNKRVPASGASPNKRVPAMTNAGRPGAARPGSNLRNPVSARGAPSTTAKTTAKDVTPTPQRGAGLNNRVGAGVAARVGVAAKAAATQG